MDSIFLYNQKRGKGNKTDFLIDETSINLNEKFCDCSVVNIFISLSKIRIEVTCGINDDFEEYVFVIDSRLQNIKKI